MGVAGPPAHAAPEAALFPGLASFVRSLLARVWHPRTVSGWAGSLALHTLLLMLLAFWYFAPRSVQPLEFESRTAGSPDGRLDGDQLHGGSDGSPVALADEVGAFESAGPIVRSDVTLPSETELAQRGLTSSAVSLELAAPIRPEQDAMPGRGRRPGNGIPGNIGAGDGQGFGMARFGDGGEMIRGVKVKVGDPQLTLIWDTKSVDIDLHVKEPKGDHLYFGHRNGRQGGQLDVDNTWGYGPENIYWLVPSGARKSPKVKGPGPPGAYKWSVHYYAAHRPDHPPVHWQVRIKHAGEAKIVEGVLNAPGEWSQIYELKVHPPKDPGPSESEPKP